MTSRRNLFLRYFGNRWLRAALLVLIGISAGVLLERFVPWKGHGAPPSPEIGTRMQPGPWGELYCVPFSISAPDELLPIRTIEAEGTHWLFKNSTLSALEKLLDSLDLPVELRNALLDPAVAHVSVASVELTPTPAMVVALPAKARQVLYRQLAQSPENRTAFASIQKSTLSDRFDDSGVSRQTLSLFHSLCCENGDYLVFGGLPAMLSQLPSYEEKVRFMKALTRQKTMLLQIRLTKESDLTMLADYWGKGCWSNNVRTILDSVQRVPGGTFLTVMALLPPLPSSELYFYPIIPNPSPGSPPPLRDCHWTSLNFFRDTADLESVDPESFVKNLTEHYYPVYGDPRYGDILVLTTSDGGVIHSAVFIADNVVFTKNGATQIYPWMFSTVADLLKQYSFLAPEGQRLTLRYFRNKGL